MSATSCGEDNPSDITAISPQGAEPKEGEGNVCPVSLVQQIFSDPKALNLLWQAFNSSSHSTRGSKLCRGVQGSLSK